MKLSKVLHENMIDFNSFITAKSDLNYQRSIAPSIEVRPTQLLLQIGLVVNLFAPRTTLSESFY